MVECESEMEKRVFMHIRVLIDTWWNVNIMTRKVIHGSIQVLIDTWWNVNIR